MSFSKIIIWGYRPPMSHTHHAIHYGFFKAFTELGFETLWLDDNSDISNINFDNSLFITEHQVDDKIPHNQTSKYALHNCAQQDYDDILPANKVNFQFFHKDVLTYETTKINDYTFVGSDIIYQCWGTDLLPREVNLNHAHNEMYKRECVWVGSYSPDDRSEYENNSELDPFFNECKKYSINIKIINPWVSPISYEENRKLVRQAYMAPSINGAFQKKTFYIPCRVLKAISYGHLGITNNSYVNKIFDDKLVYDPDPTTLFHKTLEMKNSGKALENIRFLMNEVKTKHTFLNRAQVILDFFK